MDLSDGISAGAAMYHCVFCTSQQKQRTIRQVSEETAVREVCRAVQVEIPSDMTPFVERLISERRFLTPSDVLAEGLRLLQARESLRTEVIDMSIGPLAHPLACFAGMLRDDPLLPSWKQAMDLYRQKGNDAPDAL